MWLMLKVIDEPVIKMGATYKIVPKPAAPAEADLRKNHWYNFIQRVQKVNN
jgi:hypothetical protein